jgi:exosortase A-associated hydrolase 1
MGVVIIVGGPQTRVGSHRQFTLLSRALASAGYPTLRFDYRGMGDSTGEQRNFEAACADIGQAIDTLQRTCAGMRKVVLWGLCDAASAALLYWHERRDPRVAGFCLLNPWVRSPATLARTQIRHYYVKRLLQPAFWRKLLVGRLSVGQALSGLRDNVRIAGKRSRTDGSGAKLSFQDRMAETLRLFPGPSLVILSGQDYTAKEFLEYARSSPNWTSLLKRPTLIRAELPEADHTFSSAGWRREVEAKTVEWLRTVAKEPATAE